MVGTAATGRTVEQMHETALAKSILDIVFKAALQAEAKSVRKIHLQIGQLTAVQEDSLRFALEILSRHTPAQSALINIEKVPVHTKCHACSYEGPPADTLVLICPRCACYRMEVLSGRELAVRSIEIEDDETDTGEP